MTLGTRGIERMLESLARQEAAKLGGWPAGLDGGCSVQALMPEGKPSAFLYLVEGMFGLTDARDALIKAATLQELSILVASRWNRERIIFFTSGSTGQPKACPHALTELIREARFHAGLFGNRRRVAALVPAHHIYGFLFTVLLPEILTIPVQDVSLLTLPSLPQHLEPGDLVVGFPFFWNKCAATGLGYPDTVEGVTSTGPCPPESFRAALAGGLLRMTEVYGSSETGGIGYRHSPDAPFRLLPFWLPPAPEGTQCAHLERTPASGGQPARHDLQDVLGCEGGGYVRPLGRKDMAVQVAGVNIFPEKVRQCMLGHPDVANCQVRLMHPDEGDRLKAFVVRKDSGNPSPEALREFTAWLKARLAPLEVPRSISFGSSLPVNAMGKPCDWTDPPT